jgi:hypothetical protein
VAQQPLVGQGLLIIEAPRPHSDKLHTVGLLCMSDQPDAETSTWQHTQHSQETDIYAPGWIRAHNPSKRAEADPRLRPRGQWDRLISRLVNDNPIALTGKAVLLLQIKKWHLTPLCFQGRKIFVTVYEGWNDMPHAYFHKNSSLVSNMIEMKEHTNIWSRQFIVKKGLCRNWFYCSRIFILLHFLVERS